MPYDYYGITPEEIAFYILEWLKHDAPAALANVEEIREKEALNLI